MTGLLLNLIVMLGKLAVLTALASPLVAGVALVAERAGYPLAWYRLRPLSSTKERVA